MAYEKCVETISGGKIYITDSSVIAKKLLEQGEAVLVYLHEGNRQEDFHFCRYACEDVSEVDGQYLDQVYRRYRGLPWKILETEHCIVRETTVTDVDAFYKIYEDPSITEYMEPLYEDPEEERIYAQEYIEKVYGFYNFGIWTVLDRETEEVIGRAGICYREGYEDPELGFMIAGHRQGRGLATEVCKAILKYAGEELGFSKVLAFVQPGNAGSVRVCEKLGMTWKGQTKDVKYDIYERDTD